MLIYILALDDVFDTGLASLADILRLANELGPMADCAAPFSVRLVGVRHEVKTAQGFMVPSILASDDLPVPNWVLIPALGAKMKNELVRTLSRPDIVDAVQWLKNLASLEVSLGAACTGTFILAETGVLAGRSATTSWWLSALFRQRYPLVKVNDTKMLVTSKSYLTAGAAMAHLDLGLRIVRQKSLALANLCARYLLIEKRDSQAQFIIPDHIAHTDAIVERFERWIRSKLADRFSIEDAAHAIGTSERTLNRRLQSVLGKTPVAYLQDLRIQQAVHLLRTSEASIERIAEAVGYADGATLRTLIRKKLGKSIKEFKRH